MLYLFAAVGIIWIVADWGYSLYVARLIRVWEADVERGIDGVRVGCDAFEMGAPYSKAAVLMVHGLNDSPACFRRIAPVIAEAGFYCRAVRLDGFAETTEGYSHGTRGVWLRQIETELDSLNAQFDRVHIVAHSLGGALSTLYLCDHPNTADSIVLIAPGIDVSNARSPMLSARAWHNVANCLLLSTRVTASPFGIDAQEVTDEDYPYRTRFTPRVIFDESFAVIDALRGREQDFRTPVLLAVSRKDVVIDPAAAETFVSRSKAPRKVIEHFDDSGHALLVDHTAARLSHSIILFLDDANVDDGDADQ